MIRRLAVNKYHKSLYPLLVQRYGKCDDYTAGQVTQTVNQFGFSKKHIRYALALYIARSELERIYGVSESAQLRAYIAKRFFNNDLEYMLCEHRDFFVGNQVRTSSDVINGSD